MSDVFGFVNCKDKTGDTLQVMDGFWLTYLIFFRFRIFKKVFSFTIFQFEKTNQEWAKIVGDGKINMNGNFGTEKPESINLHIHP